jgi:hypothetical protein
MADSPKERGAVITVVREFFSAFLVELLVIRGIFKDIFNFREVTVTEQNEKDKEAIAGYSESYVYWEPGGDSVTLDGSYDVDQLKTVIRFMENGGPGKGNCKHEEL